MWADVDRDGIAQPSESGIAQVTVDLYEVIPDSPGALRLIAVSTTDDRGDYAFAGLPYGHYLVRVSDRNRVLLEHTRTTPFDELAVDLTPASPAVQVFFGYAPPPGSFSVVFHLPLTMR